MQGHVTAQYALGKLLLSDDVEVHDMREGLRWLKTAVENGSHYAAYRLGKEYLRGKIVGKDANKAMAFFTQSAEAGNSYAQYALGKLYLQGERGGTGSGSGRILADAVCRSGQQLCAVPPGPSSA